MTQSPDKPRSPVFFRLAAPLIAAILTLGLLAGPAEAIESVPAVYKGKYETSCKEIDENSFSLASSKKCWVCPGDAPTRSRNAVVSKGACFKAESETLTGANFHGKEKGLIRKKCKKGKLDIRTGKCYTCPKGAIRTHWKVTSEKACLSVIPEKIADAIPVDASLGCPSDSWRHGLTDKCYTCPEGSVRNAKLRLDNTPDKFDACTVTSIAGAANKARILGAAPAASKHSEDKRTRLSLSLADIVNEDMEKRDDPNGYRRRKMSEQLRYEIDADDGFNVVTLVGGANISFVGGYGHMRGFAMGLNKDGEKVCREVFSNSATLGVSAGAGGGMEMGIWRVNMEDVAGETNGVQGGISLLLGYSNGIHWAPDGKWTKPSDYVGLTVMNGVTNSGTGSGATGGVALEVGVEYVHGWTKARCTVPCDELDWDDIPLLDSNASCS